MSADRLREGIRREIEHMARENDNMSRYWGSRLQHLLDEAEETEPEYEYAIRGKRWNYPSDARFDTLEEVHEWLPRYTQKPSDWVIVRRRRAGNWEDVK